MCILITLLIIYIKVTTVFHSYFQYLLSSSVSCLYLFIYLENDWLKKPQNSFFVCAIYEFLITFYCVCVCRWFSFHYQHCLIKLMNCLHVETRRSLQALIISRVSLSIYRLHNLAMSAISYNWLTNWYTLWNLQQANW